MSFSKIRSALRTLASGQFVVVADDEGRENEGDLIIPASAATPEKIAFMVRHTSGLLCVGARGERLDELELPLMVPQNSESHQTAFTVSVDYRRGTTTGISAADRCATIRALADRSVGASGFARPGHVFPLRARTEGVLARPGHTEAACDLAELAGFPAVGALAEIVSENGGMARRPELLAFAARHRLEFITIADLVEYRRAAASSPATMEQPLLTPQHSSPHKEPNDARIRAVSFGMHSAS